MLKEIWHIVKKYHLTQGVVNYNRLRELAERQGYRVIELYPNENKQSIQTLLRTLHLEEFAWQKKSFVYTDDNNKFLFIRKGLSEDELEILYWHELGHIWLKHTYTNDSEIIQEFEANRLVSYIKAYIKIVHIAKYILSVSTILLLLLLLFQPYKTNNAVISEEIMSVSMSPMPTSNLSSIDTVTATKKGTKFHKPDCQHVKGRSGTYELTRQDAIERGLEPCKTCLP